MKENYRRRAKQSGASLSQWVRNTLDTGTLTTRGSIKLVPKPQTHQHLGVTTKVVSGRELALCACGAVQLDDDRWT